MPNTPITADDVRDHPTYWFVVLEEAVEQGDHQTAAEAHQQLARLGDRVAYGQPRRREGGRAVQLNLTPDPKANAASARRVTVKGKRMVMIDEAAYEALLRKADLWEPDLPAPDGNGNYPALEALAVVQARDVLRARRKLGLSQVELARRAGVRPETLNRIEQGRNKPSVPTLAKIDRALSAAAQDGK